MNCFCTIITSDYLHYALALHKSLLEFGNEIKLYILITDGIISLKEDVEKTYPGTFIIYTDEVCSEGLGKSIYDKYYKNDLNAFRWSMKPVFIKYLLEKHNYQKVIYTDADIYFFNDYQFLMDELDIYDVLLSPHWRTRDPHVDPINFGILYTSGLFNGGFIGTNKNAIPALNWWAMATEYICVINPSIGMFGDQVHLNLLPVYFENIGILKHRGCNIANWNIIECKRSLKEDQITVIIANKYPIIFIHFTKSTIYGIQSGEDVLLLPYMKKYYAVLNTIATALKMPSLQLPVIQPQITEGDKYLAPEKQLSKSKIKKVIKKIIHGL